MQGAPPSAEKVWAYTAPGKLKLVDPEVAEQEGWEIDTRPPRGFSASVGVVTPHLSAREAKLVSEQAGVPIRDRDDRVIREIADFLRPPPQ